MKNVDTLTDDQIFTEINFYKKMFSAEMNRVQNANHDKYAPHPFGHFFVWGTVTLVVNEMTGKTKRYKACLTSGCASNIYELADEVASKISNIEVTHINLD